ncbi:hypothetical protein HKX48_004623 [Thoreauomyces humboldtii]|nr:hypothetical protein HKX48_004623 [Thoreauomyces humboldtii]
MTNQLTRNVWAISNTGAIDNLKQQTQTIGALAEGCVRVTVRAIGLNFADVFCCLGLYSAFSKAGATVPGLEFSGVVEADGNGFKLGDRVYGTARFGAYATRIDADARYLRKIPEGWSFQQAAAYPVQTITAWYALKELGTISKGATVLVQSAAGGVGLQALRILEAIPDVSLLGVVGSPSKIDFLNQTFPPAPPSSAGPRKAWKYISRESPTSFNDQISTYLSAHNLSGFDIVLDSVLGPAFKPTYEAMNPCGRMVIFGAASLAPSSISLSPLSLTFYSPANIFRMLVLAYRFVTRPRMDPMQLVQDNKALMGFNLIWVYDKLELMTGMYTELEAMHLKAPHVGHTFGWDELPGTIGFLSVFYFSQFEF